MAEKVYNILIVDDEKHVLESLENTISRAKEFKCTIKTSQHPLEALAFLEDEDFDAVVSDYQMPELNGVELLTEVKKKSPDSVRILVTGYGDLEIAKKAISMASVHSFEEKPWDNEKLRRTIWEGLQRKTDRDEEQVNEVRGVNDAMDLIKSVQKEPLHLPETGKVQKKRILLSFDSSVDFNKFSFEVRKMTNVSVEDIQIFENKFLILVNVYPESYEVII